MDFMFFNTSSRIETDRGKIDEIDSIDDLLWFKWASQLEAHSSTPRVILTPEREKKW